MPTKEDMIYDIVKRTEEKVDIQNGKLSTMQIEQVKMKGGIKSLEKEQGRIMKGLSNLKQSFWEHRNSNKVHYNPNFNEGRWERMKRKKGDYLVAGGVGSVIIALLTFAKWLLETYG